MRKLLLSVFAIWLLMFSSVATAQDASGQDNTGTMLTLQAGDRTSLTGVANIVSPNAFALSNVAYADLIDSQLLVFPGNSGQFSADINNGLPVQVTGEIINFDIAEVDNRVSADLDESAFSDFDDNDWALIATSVQPLLSNQATNDDLSAYAENVEADPSAYFDRTVWVRGTAEILGANAFRLDNTSPIALDGDLLVFPGHNGEFSINVNNGLPVSVFGTFMAYDAATLENEYGLDLDEDALADYDSNDYALVASSVGRWLDLSAYAETAGMTEAWADLGLDEIRSWDNALASEAGLSDHLNDNGLFYGDDVSEGMSATDGETAFDDTASLQHGDVDPYDLLDRITDAPDQFYGDYVRIAGSVEGTEFDELGSFIIVEDDLIGDDPALVIPRSPDEFTAETWPMDDDVAVTGWVRQFAVADLEAELGYDLDENLYADFEGYPVIVAESVTNTDP